MSEYQVLARRYRPKKFKEVIGQDPIVKTLKNSLKFNRLAHAYLFCGCRGTGKTTLARIFAKSLNCEKPDDECEPCCSCPSCGEIAASSSIDVLEIDGASHRGIDDIRIITESVGYAPSKGKFKVYLIDEVHMLTKEAFNALLKTLEEPPPQVKFFFCTTEPHKVPQTILSRCQRFNLKRIPLPLIIQKLEFIAKDLKITVEEEALRTIAEYAEGGLRDAESFFDQIIAFSDGTIESTTIYDVLGIMPRKWFFAFDSAFRAGDLAQAFQISNEVFIEGKDLTHFLHDFAEHFRKILMYKTKSLSLDSFDPAFIEGLKAADATYSMEQCLQILDLIIAQEGTMKTSLSQQIHLDALFLRILRERHRIPIEHLVRKLVAIEKELKSLPQDGTTAPKEQKALPKPQIEAPEEAPCALAPPSPPPLPPEEPLPNKGRYDTLMQFASVELDGTLQRRK
jgi:DNA polymerase III subunit gamma/tau